MKNEYKIIDVKACYKTIDKNTVTALLEIKIENSNEYEMIFKYTFSLNSLEKNNIEVYKELKLSDIYNIYLLVNKDENYKGIFDIYFKVYQNELNNLRKFAIEKLSLVNTPKKKVKPSTFSQIKNTTKKLWHELLEEGSTNELNGTIIKVAAYKKECPKEKLGEYANRYAIDIIRYGVDVWESVYSYEYGKYKTRGILQDVDSVSIYKILTEEEIFKIISLLHFDTEYEVITKYLKTTPKCPHGNKIEKNEEKPNVENIKFL